MKARVKYCCGLTPVNCHQLCLIRNIFLMLGFHCLNSTCYEFYFTVKSVLSASDFEDDTGVTVNWIVLVIKIHQGLDISLMKLVDLLHCRLRCLVHLDGGADHQGHGLPVGDDPEVVLEYPATKKHHRGEPHDVLKIVLNLSDQGTLIFIRN